MIPAKGKKGFTLVEVLVSATILSVAAASVISILKAGAQIQTLEHHRKNALVILLTTFERPAFSRFQYDSIQDLTDSVIVDYRDPGTSADDLTGLLRVTVTHDTLIAWDSTRVPCKRLDAIVAWAEPEKNHEIALSKVVAR